MNNYQARMDDLSFAREAPDPPRRDVYLIGDWEGKHFVCVKCLPKYYDAQSMLTKLSEGRRDEFSITHCDDCERAL